MRLLLTSDLHSQSSWFDWIAEAHADAVLIAGDLIDGFSPEGLLPQMIAVSQWAERLQCPLAFCSGNHDANFAGAVPSTGFEGIDPITASLALAPKWMDALGRPGVVVDGRSEVVQWGDQKLVVTTIPYGGFDDSCLTDRLWDAGSRLRRENKLMWFVLHHEPPAGTNVGGPFGDSSLLWRILENQPDFVLSGHIHGQPYQPDGGFAERIGKTWCFNPGVPLQQKARTPNYVWLDTVALTAVWHATAIASNEPLTHTVLLE